MATTRGEYYVEIKGAAELKAVHKKNLMDEKNGQNGI